VPLGQPRQPVQRIGNGTSTAAERRSRYNWDMDSKPAHPRVLAAWCGLWLTTAALLSCAPAAPSVRAPTPFATLRTVRSPVPTDTPVPAHATANALLLTAVVLANRGEVPQAIGAAQTALVLATSEPADAARAASFLTRAPLRAVPGLLPTQPPIVPGVPAPEE
jgi:hypothetical protein